MSNSTNFRERNWDLRSLLSRIRINSDHGSDFTSARLERVCLETHIRLIHSRTGVPQGRGKNQRFYGTITTELLPHLPGHIPHGTNGRPITAMTLTLEQLEQLEQHRRVIYRHRVQQPSALENAGGARPALGCVRVHPSRAYASGGSRHSLADRRRNHEGVARWHPIRVHPIRLDRLGRLCRRAGHRTIQPARCQRNPRLLQRHVPLPRNRARGGRRFNLSPTAANCPNAPPTRPQATTAGTAQPRRRASNRFAVPPTRAHRRESGATW